MNLRQSYIYIFGPWPLDFFLPWQQFRRSKHPQCHQHGMGLGDPGLLFIPLVWPLVLWTKPIYWYKYSIYIYIYNIWDDRWSMYYRITSHTPPGCSVVFFEPLRMPNDLPRANVMAQPLWQGAARWPVAPKPNVLPAGESSNHKFGSTVDLTWRSICLDQKKRINSLIPSCQRILFSLPVLI